MKILDILQSVQSYFKTQKIIMQLEPVNSLEGYFLFLTDNQDSPITMNADIERIVINLGVICVFQSPVQTYKEFDRYMEILRSLPISIPIKDDKGTLVCSMELSDTNGCKWNHQFGTAFGNIFQLINYQQED